MLVVDHWNRYYGFKEPEETRETLVTRDTITLNYRCAICGSALVEYPPGRHDVDEWHVACGKCGNTKRFIHANEVARQKNEMHELLDSLDPEVQGDAIRVLQKVLGGN